MPAQPPRGGGCGSHYGHRLQAQASDKWDACAERFETGDLAVGQNQRYHFGVGAPLILVYFSGDWDVHWGYGFLTHGHLKPVTPADH